MVPALSATRPDVQETLKRSRAAAAPEDEAVKDCARILVTSEVAVALMLLASAGLMIESLRRMYSIDIGFDPKNVLTLRLFLPAAKYCNGTRALQFHRQALDRIAAIPGVESVAAGSQLPLQPSGQDGSATFDPRKPSPPRSQGERPGVGYIYNYARLFAHAPHSDQARPCLHRSRRRECSARGRGQRIFRSFLFPQ